MRRLYGVTDERIQMAKIRYLHMKDDTQRLICRTLCYGHKINLPRFNDLLISEARNQQQRQEYV